MAGWRLVTEGVCTPEQLRTTFTYEDVTKSIEMLDLKAKIEEKLNAGS